MRRQGHLVSIQITGHDDVTKQKINVPMGFQNVQRLLTIGGGQDFIANLFQIHDGDIEQGFFIIDNQDGFVANGQLNPLLRHRFSLHCVFKGTGQKNPESGADADL